MKIYTSVFISLHILRANLFELIAQNNSGIASVDVELVCCKIISYNSFFVFTFSYLKANLLCSSLRLKMSNDFISIPVKTIKCIFAFFDLNILLIYNSSLISKLLIFINRLLRQYVAFAILIKTKLQI